MPFTDSHCHLDFSPLNENLPRLLTDCCQQGIHRILVPAVSKHNWSKVLALPTQQAVSATGVNLLVGLGIHPWYLADYHSNDLALLEQTIGAHRQDIAFLGELGLDGAKAKHEHNLEQQMQAFRGQLMIANDQQLPVVIHHRQSHNELITELKKCPARFGGIIHGFSGSYQQAMTYIDMGFKLGIGGTISYPRAKKTINAIKRLPLSALVLETDAPAMPLDGCQGEPNSPIKLVDIFNYLVAIRAESAPTIEAQLESNINQLWPG